MTQDEYINELKERLATQDVLLKMYEELLEKANTTCALLIEKAKGIT